MFQASVRDIRVVKRYEREQPHRRSAITTAEVAAFQRLTPSQANLLWERSARRDAAATGRRPGRIDLVIGWLAGVPDASTLGLGVAVNPTGIPYGWWAIANRVANGGF
ncbi:hypothetical protein FLP10_00630 [Agromyces intestinalis]|uniref:Uncharacterized protein n=1 Tax=Agromyces intestinalis TaxID=2592652 RepID=A0A5C1YDL4_9MICO|nr:hypothetical protein [Agromyces intestinalis]QEO13087.1 hypothetical protein FLP10_00630 [Agromyces intestinalis]